MELKVWVDGIQRVVCGVNENTTCQEVVIALAQAMGKDRVCSLNLVNRIRPSKERKLLASLSKWGQQVKEVQLILNRTGPSLSQRAPVAKAWGPERNLHRQSLPPLAKLRNKSEKAHHPAKEPKRKSLTFAEGAREWLESLGKGRECKVKVKQPEKEVPPEGEGEDTALGLSQRLASQQEALQSLQAQVEASEGEIQQLKAREEPEESQEAARLQGPGPGAEQVEFWENELKGEELHRAELRQQLEEVEARLRECEEKLAECEGNARGLEEALETHREAQSTGEGAELVDVKDPTGPGFIQRTAPPTLQHSPSPASE
uniref:Ras-associating domain-containing protein n=1 Tax=Callorhinchus milii TaxID=7868 RepID=A0A4W3H771_CALMI